MSFNIRYDNADDGAQRWSRRRELVVRLLKRYRPDLLGLQETLYHQLNYLLDALPAYDWVGVGRDDGRRAGEFTPILYRPRRLQCLQGNTFWLSPTPERPGSRGWGNDLPRIVTWARFRERQSGTGFWHANTHLDHASVRARGLGARMLRRWLKTRCQGQPILVTGDFNCLPTAGPLRWLTGWRDDAPGAWLIDSRTTAAAPPVGPRGTFRPFFRSRLGPRIDYILVSRDIDVARYVTVDDTEPGLYPSDHRPVLVDLRLP